MYCFSRFWLQAPMWRRPRWSASPLEPSASTASTWATVAWHLTTATLKSSPAAPFSATYTCSWSTSSGETLITSNQITAPFILYIRAAFRRRVAQLFCSQAVSVSFSQQYVSDAVYNAVLEVAFQRDWMQHLFEFFFFFLNSNGKEEHEKSIFTRCEKHGYRLKDNVQFHLYISTSPCGDARIFSPHEAGVEG